jgi:hypothetical protein
MLNLSREAFTKYRRVVRDARDWRPDYLGCVDAEYDDPLFAAWALSRRIGNYALDGRLLVCAAGTDCDGFDYAHYGEIPATLTHYRAWIDADQASTDSGNVSYSIVDWSSSTIPEYWQNRSDTLAREMYNRWLLDELCE